MDGLLNKLRPHLRLEHVENNVEKVEQMLAHFWAVHVDWKQPKADFDVLPCGVVAKLLGLSHLVEHVLHKVAQHLQGVDDGGLGLALKILVLEKAWSGLEVAKVLGQVF